MKIKSGMTRMRSAAPPTAMTAVTPAKAPCRGRQVRTMLKESL